MGLTNPPHFFTPRFITSVTAARFFLLRSNNDSPKEVFKTQVITQNPEVIKSSLYCLFVLPSRNVENVQISSEMIGNLR